MEMGVLWGSMRRRWYLVMVLAILTCAATFLVAQRVGPTYEAGGTVLVFPPAQSTASDGTRSQGNPYLALGGVNQARDVIVRALTSKKVSDEFGKTYPTGMSYEIVPDYTNSAPIILFTVEASNPDVATAALDALVSLVPVELRELQSGLGLPEPQQVSSVVLTSDKEPATTHKSMIRSAIIAGAAVGGSGLLLIALIDGLLAGRRAPDADGEAHEDADERAFVTLHRVASADGAPAPAVTTKLVRRRRPGADRDEAS